MIRLSIPLAALMFVIAPAQAQTYDLQQPISIDADSAEVDYKTNSSRYSGDVRLTQGSITVKANEVILRRAGENAISAELLGQPATYSQDLDDGTRVLARANKILYGAENSIIELSGNAIISRGKDKVSAQNIRYDIREGRTSGTGRVSVTITPPPAKP